MGACEEMADSTVQGGMVSQPSSGQNKKRKNNHASSSSFHCGSDLDEETGEDNKSTRTDDNKKQNHSEIEKRRRDKMNTYITELSSMVPMCHAMSRKLDKLTVLRMAVQHLKAIRGHLNSYTEGNYKPSFLSDLQLKQLILQGGEGFLFVVSCDRGRILYVSESVTQALSYSQGELLGQSWFDILHPKDVSKVKEQLTSSDLRPRQTLIDAKTMLPMKAEIPEGVSRLSPGARRSFFCRMKCKIPATIKEEADTTTGSHKKKKQHTSADRRYRVVQCTGYLKSWEAGRGLEEGEADEGLSCLVAVGRLPPPPPPPPTHTPTLLHLTPLQYISRHALDGKFIFVDQRATLVVGYLPQELLGTSMYEYFSHEDIAHLANSHKSALQDSQPLLTQVYRFRERDGNYVHLQSEWKVFRNPWTKEIEYLVAKNSKLQRGDGAAQVESSSVRCESATSLDILSSSTGELARVISSQVEIGQIGRRIADQVRKSRQPSPPPGLLSRALIHDRLLLTQDAAAPVSTNLEPPPQGEGDEMMEMMTGTVSPEQVSPSDGNDEAAMAVIMSLLEADAGLGGPVDFTGLPWPLP